MKFKLDIEVDPKLGFREGKVWIIGGWIRVGVGRSSRCATSIMQMSVQRMQMSLQKHKLFLTTQRILKNLNEGPLQWGQGGGGGRGGGRREGVEDHLRIVKSP